MSAASVQWWGMLVTKASAAPVVSGGFSDAPIDVLFNGGFGSYASPVAVAGTFHDGSTPGVWKPSASGSEEDVFWTGGTWAIHLEATLTCAVDATMKVAIATAIFSSGTVLVDRPMVAGDTYSFTHDGTYSSIFVVLLLLGATTTSVLQHHLVGLMTFTWV